MEFTYFLAFNRLVSKLFYRIQTRLVAADDVVFLNIGYEEDPPMAVPLAESDEPDRFSIQLYHRTATQADLRGRRVLEVGCGHGGGASYLMRTLRPASYTGLDLNRAAIAFCRNRHILPGVDFVHGSAEKLPFPDQSFDAVINIESSAATLTFPVSSTKLRVSFVQEATFCTPIFGPATASQGGRRRLRPRRCGCSRRRPSTRRFCGGWR